MSSFVKSYLAQDGTEQRLSPVIQAMMADWPELTEAMLGSKGPDGKQAVWPVTLMLFIEGDQMKFCLSPKFGDKVAFGTLLDPLKGIEGVEEAIKTGKFEWKKRKANR